MLIDGDLEPIHPSRTTRWDKFWLTIGGLTYAGLIVTAVYFLVA